MAYSSAKMELDNTIIKQAVIQEQGFIAIQKVSDKSLTLFLRVWNGLVEQLFPIISILLH